MRKVKTLTKRSNGMGFEQGKLILHQTIRGWMEYFKYADMKQNVFLKQTNGLDDVFVCVYGNVGKG